ncbi:MAG TPA: hypothetical protein GX747_01585 [Tenericutes bacterium]|nr:hypothetical protein [Mycoplasmatota bacterium]
MDINLVPLDTYVVINKTFLSEYDRKILTLFYQPIIGGLSINLYFTLWANLNLLDTSSNVYNHYYLMSNLRIKLNEILEAREKLEAIGLIKTYVKKGDINTYIYELYSPLNVFDFINNPILNTLLLNNLGEKEYKRLINHFNIPNISYQKYENISKSFTDIFKTTSIDEVEVNTNNIRRISTLDINFEPNIDLNNIFSLIPEGYINISSIDSNIRNIIYKLAFVYNFDDEQMVTLIKNSVDEKKVIDIEKLKINCRNYYKFENAGKVTNIIYKSHPEYLRTNTKFLTQKDKLIYTFETISPYEFLYSKNKGVKPTSKELEIIEKLIVDYEFTPGVVNVLLDYILKINDNKLIIGFIETVASQWKKYGINKVTDAMELAEKEYKNRQKISAKNIKNNKKVEKPYWEEKGITKSSMSSSKSDEIDEILKIFE